MSSDITRRVFLTDLGYSTCMKHTGTLLAMLGFCTDEITAGLIDGILHMIFLDTLFDLLVVRFLSCCSAQCVVSLTLSGQPC